MKDFIKDFWSQQAQEFKGNHQASWGDKYAIELELELISNHIQDNDRVLDVGCANGFASIMHAKKDKIELYGIDFSEEMIKYANINKLENNLLNVDFRVGDVMEIPFENETFDVVYTTRVLINLPTWEMQKIGIDECIRVVKKSGKVIFLEGFYEPLVKLNSLRSVMNLNPLEEHDFNRYLKKSKLESYLKNKGLAYSNVDFSSIYYLGSRFLRELVTDYNAFPSYSNPINAEFCDLQKKYKGGDFGIQQAYIINK